MCGKVFWNNPILSHLFILNQEQYPNIGPASRTNIWVLLLMWQYCLLLMTTGPIFLPPALSCGEVTNIGPRLSPPHNFGLVTNIGPVVINNKPYIGPQCCGPIFRYRASAWVAYRQRELIPMESPNKRFFLPERCIKLCTGWHRFVRVPERHVSYNSH